MRPTSPTGIERTRPRGFTLVELLIVLGLLALLSAILAPMLLPSAARTLQATGNELAIQLREARRLARAERRPQRLTVDTAERSYRLRDTQPWRALPDGISVELTTAQSLLSSSTQGAIAFHPDGSSSGGRILLGLDGHARQIDVEWLTGRVTVAGVAP